MRVHIITIGDEILIGQIVDTNSAWMGEQLNLIGAMITRIITISDDLEDIRQTIRASLQAADVVLMTGGLGPTRDDKTKEALATEFGQKLVFHPETYARMEKMFERWGRTPTPAHRKQAALPDGCTVLPNNYGSAPGMWFDAGHGKILVSMPGVPREMKGLMEEEVLPRLKTYAGKIAVSHRTLLTVGEGEARLAQRIEDIEDELPEHIKLAYLPSLGQVRLRLSGQAPSAASLNKELDEWATRLEKRIPGLVFGRERMELAEAVGQLLRKHNLTLGLAESCTGGLAGYQMARIPGASQYFLGSIVAYAYEAKEDLLEVPKALLDEQGAVSKACVLSMEKGARKAYHSDIGVAISGIAGPGGGTPEKPVGTIWLAIGDVHRSETVCLHLSKDRHDNMSYTAIAALNLIRQFILRHYRE